jgi:hypothetical protein
MSPKPVGDLLIEQAVVVDGADTVSTGHQSILIVAGRIEHVGPATERTHAWSGRRIDARGRWVVPGIIDLHIHTTDPSDMLCYIANGVTAVRFAGVDSPSVERLRRRVEEQSLTAPTLLSAGPMLDTDPPSWPRWAAVVSDSADARAKAADLLDREGLDALFGVHGLTAELLEPIVDVARSRGVPVAGQLWRVDAREAAELGVRQLDNTSRVLATREITVAEMIRPRPVSARLTVLAKAWLDIDWPRTEELMAAMVEHGVAYCPTLIVWKYLVEPGGGSIETDPDFDDFFTSDVRAEFAALTGTMTESWGPQDRDNWAAAFEIRKEWVNRFRSLGGTVVLGTDMQFGGIAAHEELRIIVDCGLTPTEALMAATADAAAVAAKPDLGRVTVGSAADLLLVDADPRLDIQNLRKIGVVIQGGIAQDPNQLRAAARAPRTGSALSEPTTGGSTP